MCLNCYTLPLIALKLIYLSCVEKALKQYLKSLFQEKKESLIGFIMYFVCSDEV